MPQRIPDPELFNVCNSPRFGQEQPDFWLKRDGCTGTSSAMSAKGCVSYQGCRSGLAVAYCTHGGNHMVPSNAGAYIWEFFSTFN